MLYEVITQYQGWFGLCVFVIGGFMIYEMTPKGQASKKSSQEAAKAFEASIKEKKDITEQGIKTLKWSLVKTRITSYNVCYTKLLRSVLDLAVDRLAHVSHKLRSSATRATARVRFLTKSR